VPRLRVSESEMKESMFFVADHTRVSYQQDWLNELRDGATDAYVAVLLSQPLRLTRLVITDEFFVESRLMGSVLRSTLFDKSADCGLRLDVQDLKTIYLEHHSDQTKDMDARNTADVLSLFYLPSVQHISADMDNPAGPFTWPAPDPPSPSSLRSLRLTTIREPFLGPLLSVTDQLQTFHWTWLYDPNWRDRANREVIDLTQFATALSNVRNTLEQLIVMLACDISGFGVFPQLLIRGSLNALKDFDRLREFTAPITLLMGFSATDTATERLEAALPPNLEFLTLIDDLGFNSQFLWKDHELFRVLQQWLGRYRVSTPFLRGLTLRFLHIDPGWKKPMRDELEGLCEQVGVELEVIKLRADMD
jgi:hypothetical protein